VLAHHTHFNKDKDIDLSGLHSQADYLLPLFVFDERTMELSGLPGYERRGPEARTQNYGFWKTGGYRARYVAESVYDLRSRLREVGSDLVIRFGIPEVVVTNFVRAFQERGDEVEGVWLQKEMTHDEVQVETEMARMLQGTGVPMRFVHGKTLVHPADLPFEIGDTPDVFTPFRKRVESLPNMVRPCFRAPKTWKSVPPLPETPDYALDVSYEVDVDGLSPRPPQEQSQQEGQVSFHDILRYLIAPVSENGPPSKQLTAHQLQERHSASAFPLRGGESSALERLDWYFVRGKSADSSRWGKADPPPVARYKQTRNNLVGHSYSTKMSPFLSYGSISPRQIWEALDYHERKFGEDRNTYWVRFELLWRDYFFWVSEKYGDLLYKLGGFEERSDPRQAEQKLAAGWWKTWDPKSAPRDHHISRLLEGRTGIPFVDANIIELRESGFMSNRGRQNVASFLTKDLGYDWRIGAEFFQSHLIDYDPTSNYGNWQYVAGVGNDPRASRHFNVVKQAKDYDSHGEYVKLWIPALRNLHADFCQTPWLLDAEERRSYGLKTTQMDIAWDAYPAAPMIESDTWRKHYERKEGVGSKMFGNPQEKVKDGRPKRGGNKRNAGVPPPPPPTSHNQNGGVTPGAFALSGAGQGPKLGPRGTGAVGAQASPYPPLNIPGRVAAPLHEIPPMTSNASASSARSASPFGVVRPQQAGGAVAVPNALASLGGGVSSTAFVSQMGGLSLGNGLPRGNAQNAPGPRAPDYVSPAHQHAQVAQQPPPGISPASAPQQPQPGYTSRAAGGAGVFGRSSAGLHTPMGQMGRSSPSMNGPGTPSNGYAAFSALSTTNSAGSAGTATPPPGIHGHRQAPPQPHSAMQQQQGYPQQLQQRPMQTQQRQPPQQQRSADQQTSWRRGPSWPAGTSRD
jgi:deoxyribodipyrimidine photo-lyase